MSKPTLTVRYSIPKVFLGEKHLFTTKKKTTFKDHATSADFDQKMLNNAGRNFDNITLEFHKLYN